MQKHIFAKFKCKREKVQKAWVINQHLTIKLLGEPQISQTIQNDCPFTQKLFLLPKKLRTFQHPIIPTSKRKITWNFMNCKWAMHRMENTFMSEKSTQLTACTCEWVSEFDVVVSAASVAIKELQILLLCVCLCGYVRVDAYHQKQQSVKWTFVDTTAWEK